MKKNKVFYTLFFITMFLLLSSFIPLSKVENPVSGFPSIYNVLSVNIEGKEKTVIKNGKKFFGEKQTFKGRVKSLEIPNNVERAVIFNDITLYYFKNGGKLSDSNKPINFNSYLNMFSIYLLGLSVFHTELLIPYLFLLFTICCYIKFKDDIKPVKINSVFYTSTIFLCAILFRFNGLFNYQLHLDEYFSLLFSSPDKSPSYLLEDAGNPPFFYFIFRMWLSLFGESYYSIKLFPFLISILGVFGFYFVLKKLLDKKTAILGTFLYSFNLPLIYFAQDVRSYIMQALFTPFLIYFLFKILKCGKTKDYVIYGILAAILSNTHYFEILFIISNFVYAGICFIKNKKYMELFKFFITNLYAALVFLPFLSKIMIDGIASGGSFNVWIKAFDFNKICEIISYIFGGIISFFISVLFFTKTLFQKEKTFKDEIIIYSFFSLITVFIISLIISNLIIPVAIQRYYTLLIPIMIMFLASLFTKDYKIKFLPILFVIWFILIQSNPIPFNDRREGTIDFPLALAKQYEQKENSNKNIYVITNLTHDLKFKHKELLSSKIKYVEKMAFDAQDLIDEILTYDKNAVIFTTLENNSKGTCYYNSAVNKCIWKIEGR